MSIEKTPSFLRNRLLMLFVELFFFPQTQFSLLCWSQLPDVFPCFVDKGAVVMSYMSMHKLWYRPTV